MNTLKMTRTQARRSQVIPETSAETPGGRTAAAASTAASPTVRPPQAQHHHHGHVRRPRRTPHARREQAYPINRLYDTPGSRSVREHQQVKEKEPMIHTSIFRTRCPKNPVGEDDEQQQHGERDGRLPFRRDPPHREVLDARSAPGRPHDAPHPSDDTAIAASTPTSRTLQPGEHADQHGGQSPADEVTRMRSGPPMIRAAS